MGFDGSLAREALQRCGGVLHEAVQLLLESPEGAPLPPPTAMPTPASPAPAFAPPPPQPHPPPPTAIATPARSAAPPPPEAQQLMDMGFSRSAVEAALQQANHDPAAALNLLLDPSFVATHDQAASAAHPPVATAVPATTHAPPMAVATALPAYASAAGAVPIAVPPWAAPGTFPAPIPFEPLTPPAPLEHTVTDGRSVWTMPASTAAGSPGAAFRPSRYGDRPMQYEMD